MANGAKPAGLEDVVVGPSEITFLDGAEGRLLYRGIDIHDLARNSTFEETAYLLLSGTLPTARELEAFTARLRRQLDLPALVVDLLNSVPSNALPMDILRTAVSLLGDLNPRARNLDPQRNMARAMILIGAMPAIITTFWRLAHGQELVDPDPDLGLAANFLYMLRGERADPLEERVMDVALILHADHEYNASTFAARVIASTLSDVFSAVSGAIGALKGPLHGGANERVMQLLLAIGEPAEAEDHVRAMLEAKQKVPGFGHRVYRTEDPRAQHLREFSRQLGERRGEPKWFEMQGIIERTMRDVYGLYCNVDFYSATTYYNMGIPIELFTPIFAMSRSSGWTAHVIEQYENNRLIRPRAEYTGPRRQEYVPLEQRPEA